MRVCVRDGVMAALMTAMLALTTGCQQSIFRQYEYEEEIYLKLDGSATVHVNTSIAALIALRGLDLDASSATQVDRQTRDKIRAFYDSPVGRVVRVSPPWRRHGRQYVQIRVYTDDIRKLSQAHAFDWSTYRFSTGQSDAGEAQYHYVQTWGAAAGKPVANVNWDGSELVAVRMHLPSRIDYHNATSRKVERGNIVSWEQRLADRIKGQPAMMEVRMQTQSILVRTLTIFGIALAAAITLMVLIVVWVKKKGAPPAAKEAS